MYKLFKPTLLFFLLLIIIDVSAQENYQININGETINIELNKDYKVTINNKLVDLNVSMKDTLNYKDAILNFNYLKDYKVTSTKVDEGIEQLMLMTAEGTGFIIQKYSTMNPVLLTELMINEVTKESVSYGFEMERKSYDRKLISGQSLKINRAYLTYNDEVNIYEVATIGQKDEGILIMTMEMDDNPNAAGKTLINTIWESLEINF